MKTFVTVLIVLIAGCNNTGDNKMNDNTVTNDSANNKISTPDTTVVSEEVNDSTIQIQFPKDSTWVTVEGKMKGMTHPISVYIPVKQGTKLTAKIQPEDSTANIRINQVFTPDGKADGPFGRELKRSLNQQGTYKLIIAENMMQGDEWIGNFKLTIRVE